MAKPKTCALCNATGMQEHQPWCPFHPNASPEASKTAEFQAAIIEADQTVKRHAWYKAGGMVLAKATSWGPQFTLDNYVAELEKARAYRLWEESWFDANPDADGYAYDDIPESLRPVQTDSTDEARELPRLPNGLGDWSKPSKVYPPYDGKLVTE